MLRKGNFRLTKLISNDKDVLAAIPAEGRTIKNLDLDKLPIQRALGQQWNIDTVWCQDIAAIRSTRE